MPKYVVNDLAEFLLARIAEDEAVARAGNGTLTQYPHDDRGAWRHVDRWSPARVLAECEAKRRIVGYWTNAPTSMREGIVADLMLRLLSIPYADHPNYRPEWRP